MRFQIPSFSVSPGQAIQRRRFLRALAAGTALGTLDAALPAWALQDLPAARTGTPPELRGPVFDLTLAETRVDFTRPATEVHNHIRGLSPFPGAWTEMDVNGKPERVKLIASSLAEGEGAIAAPGTALDDRLTIACGTGAVSLIRLQKAGGKALSAEDFLRGTPLPKGTVIA